MIALLKIYNKNYWVSIFGPVLTFIAPVIFCFLLTLVYTFRNYGTYVTLSFTVIPSLMFFMPYILMLITLPQAIFEVKNSILTKQLKSSSIKFWQIIFVGIVFYIIWIIFSYFFSIFGVMLAGSISDFLYSEVIWAIHQINFLTMIYVLFVNILVGCSFGAMIASISRTENLILVIGFFLLFVSLGFAGFVAPLILGKSFHPTFWYISYFDPLRYPISLNFEAFFSLPSDYNVYGSTIFDVSTPYKCMFASILSYPTIVFEPVDKILDLVIPYAEFVGFITIAFTFSTKG